MSQCDVHVVITEPFSSRRAARSSYCFGSKVTVPFTLPAPVPGTAAWTFFGPPNSSAPVVMLSACSRWKYAPDAFFDIETT